MSLKKSNSKSKAPRYKTTKKDTDKNTTSSSSVKTKKTTSSSSSASKTPITGLQVMNLSFEEAKEQLKEIIVKKSIFDFDSILPSGRITTFSVDLRESLLSAKGIALSSLAILHLLQDDVRYIGGYMDSTYSLAATVSQFALLRGQEIDTFLLRRDNDAKRRGYSKWVDGPLKPASKVCIIHDEVLDGSAVIKAIRKLQEEYDAQIIQVITILDRLDGAAVKLQDYGVDYSAVFEMDEVATPAFA